MARTIRELLDLLHSDPSALTPAEMLFLQKHIGKKREQTYAEKKAKARQRSLEQSRAGADIAPLPAVKDPARREATTNSLRLWCEQYFPARFSLRWSPDHLQVL